MNERLTHANFLTYCAKHYRNSVYFTDAEFLEDIRRIKYIKKLLTRYINNNELNTRLILNHIIILSNCFEPTILNRVLYLKLKPQMQYIKPFLVTLSVMQDKIYSIESEEIIYTDVIPMDTSIVAALRKI
jgi:hypothetical protein